MTEALDPQALVDALFILVLTAFVGYEVVSKVPTMLHTPLMSGANAIHGVIVVGGLLIAATAGAQTWPQKPVRFIVPFPPGGATDISARLLGQELQDLWGQTVVIENRGGAGGGVGAAEAARAAPDGYTLFFPSGSVVTANQHIYAKLNYDPERDFVAVTNVVSGPQVVAVPAGSPYKTVNELIAGLKANPGKLAFGHAGIGSQTHLAAENFLNAAKVDALSVPYKGEGPALAGLVGGDVAFTVTNVAATLPHISSGRVRALGVTSRAEAPQQVPVQLGQHQGRAGPATAAPDPGAGDAHGLFVVLVVGTGERQ